MEIEKDSLGKKLAYVETEIESGRSLQVIPLLAEELNQYPNHPRIHYWLAVCYEENGRVKRAIKHALKARDFDQDTADAATLLSKLYLRQNKLADAEQFSREALEVDEKDNEANLLLAEIELTKKRPAEALNYVEAVLQNDPVSFEGYRLLTKIYLKQQEPLDKILTTLDQSTEYGYAEEMEYDRVYAYFIHGEFEECRKLYKKLLQALPNSPVTQQVADLMQQIRVQRHASPVKAEKPVEQQPSSSSISVESSLEKLERLTGLTEVKSTITRIVKLVQYNQKRTAMLSVEEAEQPSYHFAFYGNPGTGKTTVARILGDIFYSLGISETNTVIEVDRSDLVGEFIGQTAQKTKKVIESAMGGVLFIDEAYALAPKGNGAVDFGAEAIDTLIKAMEDHRKDLIVIFAGYKDEMRGLLKLNPGLSSRVNLQINFSDYTDEELLEIARNQAKDNYYSLTENAEKAFMTRIGQEKVHPNFANARAVRNIMEEAIRERAFRLSDQFVEKADLLILEPIDFGIDPEQLFGEVIESLLDELNSLVGLEAVKDQVTSIINYVRVNKRREENGMISAPLSMHMSFTGNPGTGKTTVARLFSKILKSVGVLKRGHVVEVTKDDLVGQYVGHTGPKTLEKIKEAYGGVLFIDEAYSLYSANESDFGYEAVSTLIKEMEDNRDKLVVILAGYTDEMKQMLQMNSGIKSRIAHTVEFPDYNEHELTAIFQSVAKQNNFTLTEDAAEKLKDVFASLYNERDKHFGNARTARSLFEKTVIRQSSRLAEQGDAHLFTIEASDIPENA